MVAPVALICCGNRLDPRDDLGPRVYDLLLRQALPAGVELLDGALAGLDLMYWLEGRRLVVLVDALADEAGGAGGVRLYDGAELAAMAGNYGHGAGLAYLAAMAPRVLDPAPTIRLLGAAPAPGAERTLARAALEMVHAG